MNVRRRFVCGVVTTLLASAVGNADTVLPTADRVILADPPKAIADFALTDADGRGRKFSEFRGQPVLVFFGFTNCPDVCPTALAKLQRLMRSDPEKLTAVKVIMISVDGDRDTPMQLKKWLGEFSKDFIGLTGDPRLVRDIAARFPAVFVKGIPASPGGPYAVQHSSLIYAVDRSGRLRAQFDDAEPEAMALVMRALLAEH